VKFGLVVLMIVGALLFAGCASSEPSTTAPPASAPQAQQDQVQTPSTQVQPQPGKTQDNQNQDLGDVINQLNPLKQTTTTLEPKDMAITRDEVPEEYGIKERGDRSKDDVSEHGKSLGWQEGYMIAFTRVGDGLSDMSGISQFISIYPLESMSRTITAPEKEENMTLSILPDPKIGEQSQAYKETGDATIFGTLVRYTIEFRKLNVYEHLTIAGTGGVDYETLKELAKKAESKIK